jgi:serine/threonine-protein kinase
LTEVRLTARLNHPNILPIKNADHVEGLFVIAFPLGECTLAERMTRRLPLRTTLDYTRQMLAAVAHAHGKRVLHCDIKPENFILFDDGALKLTDFGIAKVARRTLQASGSGTVGYLAPEQALGKPSFRSDVFSLGLILYEMFTKQLPEWPFEWPPPGYERLRRKVHPDFIAVIRRSLAVDARRRYADASRMLAAFERIAKKADKVANAGKRRRRPSGERGQWRQMQFREFKRHYGKILEANHECGRCGGPLSEQMSTCPWCGNSPKTFRGETSLPARCKVCRRGMKLDWRFCPHEYGSAQGPRSDRNYTDKRYSESCSRPGCRGPLMPFMKYCPWCRAKVRRKWRIKNSAATCPRCGWGVVKDLWSRCPWCGAGLKFWRWGEYEE